MLSLDLRNQEEGKTSSEKIQCVKLPSLVSCSATEQVQMQNVFSEISTSSVSKRLSDIHKESTSVFISVTETSSKEASRESSDEEFVMVRRESSKSTDTDSICQIKQRGSSSSEKSVDEKVRHDVSFRSSFEGSEMASPNNAVIEPFIKPSLEEINDIMLTTEHKPIPTKKQLMKISSTDLLHRQIKEDMIEQVMCEEDDSMMTESVLMVQEEEKPLEPLVNKEELTERCEDTTTLDSVLTAEEIYVEEPDWEILDSKSQSREDLRKRSMTPEQALEIATEFVQQVQTEAVKRYEEMKRSNILPKPTPDSKYTPETKEKVQVYLKELEEREEFDVVAAELITRVVSKKEEKLKLKTRHDISVDITDEEPRSEAMMIELRNELRRSSVTDEDLVTDLTCELLEEKNIDDMKKHLEVMADSFREYVDIPDDFRFQTSFRSHFVTDIVLEGLENKFDCKENMSLMADVSNKKFVDQNHEIINFASDLDLTGRNSEQQNFDSISGKEANTFVARDINIMREKKSDNESNSSGSRGNFRKSGTDQEGYSSSGETFFSTEQQASGPSRPSSSDIEAMLSILSEKHSTSEQTEYVTAQEQTSSADASFFTAASSLSSKDSVKSSESSGHLGSIEVSECSETLVESSLEYDSRPEGADTPNTFRHLEETVYEEYGYHMPSNVSDVSTSSTEKSAEHMVSEEDKNTNIQVNFASTSEDHLEIESEFILHGGKEIFSSQFSESRETLSSSVLTLSSISEATVIGGEVKHQSSLLISSSQMSQSSHVESYQVSSEANYTSTVMPNESKSLTSSACAVNSSFKSADDMASFEDLTKEACEMDQVFPMPRMRSFEGAHSVQVPIPQELSVDFGSDYDSRPESELKDVQDEPRPLSAEKLSCSPSHDKQFLFGRRAFSIDETVSDTLRVFEPFARPISPMPVMAENQESERMSSNSFDCDDYRLKVNLTCPGRAVSPCPRRLQSAESVEAEIAFSKHFTQVLDESDSEVNDMVKSQEKESLQLGVQHQDLTPESAGTSESLENSSQGQDYFLDPDSGEFRRISPKLHFDLEEQDDLLVGSPPMVSRPLGVKYWPPLDNLDQDLDACGPVDKCGIVRSESDDNSESRLDIDNEMIEKEVEQGKKWLENQFEEQPDEFGNFNPYGQPLDQILEEEEDRYSHSSEDIKELTKFKESLSSTPDFEAIINKRHQVSRMEHDDVSMGSLTEFERLEREVALGSGSGSRGSLGSNDSLEVYGSSNNGKTVNLSVKLISKSGVGDDVSVSSFNSLKSFEMIERACAEAQAIEEKAKLQEDVLSEIEEGHESQVSESDSGETISEAGGEKSDEEEFEDRMFEIDSIIKQAQANVEQFHKETIKKDEISLSEIMGKRSNSKTESIGSQDSLDEGFPEIPEEQLRKQASLSAMAVTSVTSHSTSVTSFYSVTRMSSATALTQFDADSITGREISDELNEFADIMGASVDSLDHKVKLRDTEMITSTDSLEGSTPRKGDMTISTDSIEGGRYTDPMNVSVDSLEGNVKEDLLVRQRHSDLELEGSTFMLFTSTDSIDSGSTNTRATASMLSSITSQGSETLVADDEFEYDDDSKSVRKLLLNAGGLQLEDSDDSSCSHSSPALRAKKFSTELLYAPQVKQKLKEQNVTSSEEIVETEEIDEKGNIIIKKVVQKRIIMADSMVKLSASNKKGSSSELSEKLDDSCEETIEEVDEFGNKKIYVVKRSIESRKPPPTLDIVRERREQSGMSPIGEIFKPLEGGPPDEMDKSS